MWPLKKTWEASGPAGNPFADFLNTVARLLDRVHVTGGEGKWMQDGLHLTIFNQQVQGTPGLFKVISLTGWKRDDIYSPWQQMSVEEMINEPPTVLDSEAGGSLTCLRPTWDYPRVAP